MDIGIRRAVVIGANSFTGSQLTAALLARGSDVLGISRSPEPHEMFLPHRWAPHQRYEFIQLDLNEQLDEITAAIRAFEPGVVFNTAAQGMVAQSWQTPQDWYRTNTLAMAGLHEQLAELPFLERFVHTSTPEVYGNTTGIIREDAPWNPTTPYAVSKAACDMNLLAYQSVKGLPVCLTRAANICGPGQQLYRIIPRTILAVMTGKKLKLEGGGTSIRSFIHIADVIEATLAIAERGQNGGIYHLATDQPVSIRRLVELICEQMGADFNECVELAPARLGQDAAYLLDCTTARDELGWQPKRSLETTITDTIDWMRRYELSIDSQPHAYEHKR